MGITPRDKEPPMRIGICMLAVVTASLALPASAHDLTMDECMEGSDFIMHAAQSRDMGLSREEFISRMQGDILAIQSIPPELRWFVQDADDEALLMSHAEGVFDAPQAPQVHQSHFLETCFARIAQQTQAREAVRAAQVEGR
jgi:hypothetical protein